MKRIALKFGIIACVMALCFGVFVGCSNAPSNLNESQKANRSYMSQVNGVMAQLGEDLDSFVDAVSRNDLVNMRTQADNAYRHLDELTKIEAPEDLKDVQQKYVDGTSKLREALDGYIDLFTSVEAGPVDNATYATKLGNIQKLYDEGADLLKQGDEAAASK